ncbi:hypothetical protein CCR75_008474 [Bremia lactucae]|uniref:Uncharacterized protein n=1 Tax=Bremia lactucae TaxID=4779 RepID=A0A976IJ06_BRELC|nr:hypothetical protein CCR75_008474 [Bremia lactucae]
MPQAPQPVSGLIFTHLDVADRLRHVTGLANTLAVTTAQLKADGVKNPLLTKISQAPTQAWQSGDTTASTLAGSPTSGATSPRTASPSTDEWSTLEKAGVADHGGLICSYGKSQCSVTAAGSGKSPQTVSAPYAKHSSTIKKPLYATKATVPSHGKQAAMQSKPNPFASYRSNEQRTLAARELENLLGGDHHVAEASPQTGTAVNSSLAAKSSKEQALALARSRVEDAQRAVEDLPSTAAKTKRATNPKRAYYFKAHAQALEEAITNEPTDAGSPTSLADNNAGLLRMDYDYCTASATASRAMAEATNTLKTLTRRLAKITPKLTTASELMAPKSAAPPCKLPAEMAKKDRERSRATIALLLSSHVRQKRGIPRATPHCLRHRGRLRWVRVDMPPPRTPIADGQSSRDLDITMAENTITFGNTMRMGDLNGGSVHHPAQLVFPFLRSWLRQSKKSSRPRQID